MSDILHDVTYILIDPFEPILILYENTKNSMTATVTNSYTASLSQKAPNFTDFAGFIFLLHNHYRNLDEPCIFFA